MMFYRKYKAFRNYFFAALAIGGLLFSSCMKKEVYPEIPEIAFQSFYLEFDTGLYATRGFLTISFKDGNGDIGLRTNQKEPPFDTGSVYYYNYIIDYYEMQNGTFVKVPLDPSFNARIPYLTPNDPNKAIKGIIVDTLPLNPLPLHDTVKFKFFIYDRALNKSNVDSTPPIILRRR
ncbi:MAG: hypothetical protein NT040_06120 [Bacteroidetes bacterium]|nr:hypothetical protein [Bacteroidota bacterium]